MIFYGINTEISLKNCRFIYATNSELYMNQRWKIAIIGILQKKRYLTVGLQPGQALEFLLQKSVPRFKKKKQEETKKNCFSIVSSW